MCFLILKSSAKLKQKSGTELRFDVWMDDYVVINQEFPGNAFLGTQNFLHFVKIVKFQQSQASQPSAAVNSKGWPSVMNAITTCPNSRARTPW